MEKVKVEGGVGVMSGRVGACKVEDGQFNRALACTAGGIHVVTPEGHAEGNTYRFR